MEKFTVWEFWGISGERGSCQLWRNLRCGKSEEFQGRGAVVTQFCGFCNGMAAAIPGRRSCKPVATVRRQYSGYNVDVSLANTMEFRGEGPSPWFSWVLKMGRWDGRLDPLPKKKFVQFTFRASANWGISGERACRPRFFPFRRGSKSELNFFFF